MASDIKELVQLVESLVDVSRKMRDKQGGDDPLTNEILANSIDLRKFLESTMIDTDKTQKKGKHESHYR